MISASNKKAHRTTDRSKEGDITARGSTWMKRGMNIYIVEKG